MEAWQIVLQQIGNPEDLKSWIASLVYRPLEPLSYLFIYGEKMSGKTTFVDALSLLVPDVIKIKTSIFNGPMATATLCVVEDEQVNPDWVNYTYLTINRMLQQPKVIKNKTHWVHLSNNLQDCPKFGYVWTHRTTRITNVVDKQVLMTALKAQVLEFKDHLNAYL